MAAPIDSLNSSAGARIRSGSRSGSDTKDTSIGQRHQHHTASKASQETLLKNLPGMAYRCLNLADWPMDYVSDGCAELCGYERHLIETQQVLWGHFTHPQDLDAVDAKVRQAVDIGEPFEVEYRIITKNGSLKWVWERGREVDRREDGVAIIEGLITDITDRKNAEDNLIRAETYAQAVVESALEAVITANEDGCIQTFNQEACEIFNYTASNAIGIHCRELIATEDYSKFDSYLQHCLEHSSKHLIRSIELNGCSSDHNNFPILLSIKRFRNVDEKTFIILIRDLTEQRQAEIEAKEQRDLLAHIDRLNTLGEMTTSLAHEINQPLTAISMYAQSALRFLQQTHPQLDKLAEALSKLSQQTHRAGAIIEHMQELTQPHQSHHEEVEINTLLKEAQELGEVEARIRNFNIALSLQQNLPRVRCDPIQIQQVILNLLRNGMESMRAAQCKSKSKIQLKAIADEQTVTISIMDSGEGISSHLNDQIFQPFMSTKETGLGLGLIISRSIIAAHGGQLRHYNNRGAGATFYFSLPVLK